MELTILLAKIFGMYLLIAGIAILANKKEILAGVAMLAKEKFSQIIVGFVALLIGLIVVNIHNDWSSLPAGIITFCGWASIVKGIVYLILPDAKLAKMVKVFTERPWYLVDGILAIVVGVYLANFGYGWF